MSKTKTENEKEQTLVQEVRRLRSLGSQAHPRLVDAQRRLEALRHRIHARRERSAADPYEGKRRARITPDPVICLYAKGEISPGQFDAAAEIELMWEKICTGRGLQAGSMVPSIRSTDPYCSPIEKLPFSLDEVFRKVWLPWADQMANTPIIYPTGGEVQGIRALDLMIDIAADRKSLSDQVLKIRMRKKTGLQVVKKVFFGGLKAWESLR